MQIDFNLYTQYTSSVLQHILQLNAPKLTHLLLSKLQTGNHLTDIVICDVKSVSNTQQ